ncbi:bifunctional acetate--CoA ligase family protein/GNAT family N-acetyltransferase [Phytohabitans houttuyneae]|uniref:GNAT family N-acetyltransferase n=1 Tax=Phytohabitans houttuyneae TaxID=1076126 RepID=A0A6V8KM24_9ACTN|nr:bifunctional GNAT family N-acetyltransferase/acetate--CoA ligase family protein [Phytohabitans houttuyneae]GFJ81705.1 GNAT family N-acetyltransferase [Phytohabitans houttuyneae]
MSRFVVQDCDALTADGGIVRIRPAGDTDAAALGRLFAEASPESLRLRFFAAPGQSVIDTEVHRLVRAPGANHAAAVAVASGEVVGVASYERSPKTPARAEFAVFVAEPHRGRGIGTLLLEHLAAQARDNGIATLTGEVLPGNFRMLKVARDLTSGTAAHLADGVVDLNVGTAVDDATLLAVEARDRVAERECMRPMLAPRSVAVVGAGRRPGGIGHETLRAIVEGGFNGPVYAVNPRAETVAGAPSYPSLSQLPEPVDLVVVAVPGPAVRDVLTQAAQTGVRAAVILSSGFGEAGQDGQHMQADLVRLARGHGMRLVGPNCLGIVNTASDVRLNASFAPTAAPAGGLAIASQSGAVGIALLAQAARTGCGISTFVSLGNKADVSGNDLLAYWYDDPATRAVALYLESFGNPRKFARLVRALGRRKPVLAVKSGRSAAGRRAGASHTAAAAAPDVAVDALFAQAGVIRVDTLGELLDTARLLTEQPLPAGDRLAIIGNAGGVNVLAADAAEAVGLRVPAVPAADNPLDLGAGASPEAFAAAVDALAAGGEIDAVLLVVAATKANDVDAVLHRVTPVLDRHEHLTAAAVLIGATDPPAALGSRRTPVYDLPEQAVRALGNAARYGDWRRTPLGDRPVLHNLDRTGARTLVEAALADGGGWQPYPRIAALLGMYGIPVLASEQVCGEREAAAAAAAAGYPVVLKAADPDLVHKSDIGAVHIGLADADAVRTAYRAIGAALGRTDPPVLVQAMAHGQAELVAGVVHDPLFGSLVMLGLGGVHTDLLGDRVFRLVPMTSQDAGQMWRSLRAARLLTGYRGAPPVDTAAVEDLVLRLGRLAEDIPEIAELDLNPVLVGADGAVAVDAKLRLARVDAEPDPMLRRLRQPA